MNREPDGFSLQERLFERRIVLCRGVLDDELAGRVSAELMTLDALGDAAVELQLDSHGASLEAAWTLIDVIDLLGVPVNILCSGRIEGVAAGVLSAGAKRTTLPHARFRLTDPELEISGRASELAALLDHQMPDCDGAELSRPSARSETHAATRSTRGGLGLAFRSAFGSTLGRGILRSLAGARWSPPWRCSWRRPPRLWWKSSSPS